ncbi:MAG: site-specific integrase, partial [Acidimicrobiia bacterium]
MTWNHDEYVASLTGRSPNTTAAYRRDLAQFVAWADRGALGGPSEVDRVTLRRYVAYLNTRGFARGSVARKVAALRGYFAWERRRGTLVVDPARRLRAPRGEARLPKVPRQGEVDSLLTPAGAPAGTPGDAPAPPGTSGDTPRPPGTPG